MPVFSTEEEVRSFFVLFLAKIGSHPEAGPTLRNSGLVLLFRLTEPRLSLTVDTRSFLKPGDQSPAYSWEENEKEADLILEMTAAALDELWSGRTDIFSAMLSGKLKLMGNMAKASRLVPVLKLIPPLYAGTLSALGISPKEL